MFQPCPSSTPSESTSIYTSTSKFNSDLGHILILYPQRSRTTMLSLGPFLLLFMTGVSVARAAKDDVMNKKELTAAVQDLRQELDKLKAGIGGEAVAFTAVLSVPDTRGLQVGQTLVFDSVVYNAGNAYNPSTGVFTAPSAGTYVFYTRVMRNYLVNELIQTAIYKGTTRLGAWADASNHDHDSGSTMASVYLETGDTVHVQIYRGGTLWGDHTTFTGFKLR